MPPNRPDSTADRTWLALAPLLEAPPDAAGEERVERATLRRRPAVRLTGPLLAREHPVRGLVGGLAFLELLDAAAWALDAGERSARLTRLGAALASTSGSPDGALARSMTRSIGPRGFERAWLVEALEARRDELSVGTSPTRRELADRALRLDGRLVPALARAVDRADETNLARARAIATASGLARELARLLGGWQRGRLYLALEDLRRHDVPPTALATSPPPIELKPVVLEHIAWARGIAAKGRGLARRLGRWGGNLTLSVALTTESRLRRVELLGLRR